MSKPSTAKHFVVIDIEDFLSEHALEKESIDLTQKRITCLCPFCEQYGEPNAKATLYVYPENLSLFCFRCFTYGVDKSLALSKNQLNLVKLKSEVKRNLNTREDKLILSGINLDHLPLIRDNEYITYFMTKRSYKYVPMLDKWGFREINFMGQKGIVLPFFYDNLLVDYQIRFLNPTNHRRKYYLSEGDKIPFFINGYDSTKDYSTITIVEGIFDATAADLFKLPNPVAVLGSAIPSHIFDIITKVLRPKNIIYAFDEMSINVKVRKLFSKYYHQSFFINTNGSDLDELLKAGKVPKLLSHQQWLDMMREKALEDKIKGLISEQHKPVG